MGKWGLTPFESSVRWLSPKAKQAFYAAAASRTIRQGTWNGCAFNAGAENLGVSGVSSISRAAEVFEMPEKSVSNFIRQWDQLHAENPTARLREAIEAVGLFSPRGTLRLRKLIFAAQNAEEQKAFEHIDQVVSDETVTDEMIWEMIEGSKEAMELIGA